MLKLLKKISFITSERLRKGNKIAFDAYIKHPRNIRTGNGVRILSDCMLDAAGSAAIHLGDKVQIGRHVYLGAFSTDLAIGRNSVLNRHAYIDARGGITIGADVLIGPYARLVSYEHVFDDTGVPIIRQGVRTAEIVIEDDVWIGAGATVLAGVRIGRGSVIAAGAVVTRSCDPFSVLAGVPARLIRRRTDAKAATP